MWERVKIEPKLALKQQRKNQTIFPKETEKNEQYQDQNKSQYYSIDCSRIKVFIKEINPKKSNIET